MRRRWFLVWIWVLGFLVWEVAAGEWWILTEEGVKRVVDLKTFLTEDQLKPGYVWRDPYLGMEFV